MYVIIRNGRLFALENDEQSAGQTKEAALDMGGSIVTMEISTLEDLRTTLIAEFMRDKS